MNTLKFTFSKLEKQKRDNETAQQKYEDSLADIRRTQEEINTKIKSHKKTGRNDPILKTYRLAQANSESAEKTISQLLTEAKERKSRPLHLANAFTVTADPFTFLSDLKSAVTQEILSLTCDTNPILQIEKIEMQWAEELTKHYYLEQHAPESRKHYTLFEFQEFTLKNYPKIKIILP